MAPGTVARLCCTVRSPATGSNAIRTGPVWSDYDLAFVLGVRKVLGIYFLCRMGFDDSDMKEVLAGKIAEFTLLSKLRHSSASWVDDILHQILPSPCYRMPWLQELRSVGTAVALRQLDYYRLDALITIGYLVHEDAITRKDSTVRIYEGRTFRFYGDKEYVGRVVATIREEDALELPVGYLHRCIA